MKVKNSKGEEIEIEETEVIVAIKEEYEKKLEEKDGEINKIKEANDKALESLRKEHALQVRAIISGKQEPKKEEPEFEGEEEEGEEELVKKAKEIYKKMI